MMPKASLWPAVVLVWPLVALTGCDWVPVRRRIDPLLPTRSAPVAAESRPTPSRRDDPTTPTGPTRLASEPPDQTPIPDDLIPVPPDDAWMSHRPTPMLDAALARAKTARATALGEIEPDHVGDPPKHTPQTQKQPFHPSQPDGGQASAPIPSVQPPVKSEPYQSPAPDQETEHLETSETATASEPKMTGAASAEPPEPTPPVSTPPLPNLEPKQSTPSLPTDDADQAKPPEPSPSDPEAEPSAQNSEASGPSESETPVAMASASEPDRVEPGAPDDTSPTPNAPADKDASPNDHATESSTLWQNVMDLLAEAPNELALDRPSASPAAPQSGEPESLKVSDVHLCRSVRGLGQYAPIDPEQCRPGQNVIIYCELDGVSYTRRDGANCSELLTVLRLIPVDGGPDAWSEEQLVEDCQDRPRNDYYVSYWVRLPGSLKPGRYRLMVSQQDQQTNQEDTQEIALNIIDE